MAATIRELLIKVGFDVKKEALDRAEQSVQGLRKSVMWLATGIAVTSTALFGLVYSASKAGNELGHLSEIMGIDVEELQRLKEGASLANVNFQSLIVGIRFFGRAVGEALNGQKQFAQYLRRAGITSLKDQNGQIKTQIALLKEVAEKIRNTTNAQQKLAIAQNLFGRGGADVISFLNRGATGIDDLMGAIDDYGYVLTKAQIISAQSFDSQRKKLLMFVSGAKNAIGISLIPMFNKLMERLLELIKVNKALIIQKLQKFFQGLASVLKTVVLTLWEFVGIVNNLVKSTLGWNKVLEIAGVLLGLLVANTIINGIKLLYTWIINLAKAGGLLDIALAPLNIILIAIAAAFYLAWDDLKNFEEGNLSLIGTLKKSHPIIANFIRVLGGLVEFLKNITIGTIDSVIDILKLFIATMGFVYQQMAKIPLIGKMYKKMGDEMRNPSKMVNDILKQTADNLEAINQATDPSKIRLGVQPGYAQLLKAGAVGSKSTNVTSNVEVNVTVPAGTPKSQQDWLSTVAKENFGNVMQDQIKGVLLASPLSE